MEALAPTAQRILAAARRLLVRDGFTALTLSAIAVEAEESKASIGYHFGNKDGLVAALVDSLTHDANRALIQECLSLPPGPARMQALLEGGDADRGGRLVIPGIFSRCFPMRFATRRCGGGWLPSTTAIARQCGVASATPSLPWRLSRDRSVLS